MKWFPRICCTVVFVSCGFAFPAQIHAQYFIKKNHNDSDRKERPQAAPKKQPLKDNAGHAAQRSQRSYLNAEAKARARARAMARAKAANEQARAKSAARSTAAEDSRNRAAPKRRCSASLQARVDEAYASFLAHLKDPEALDKAEAQTAEQKKLRHAAVRDMAKTHAICASETAMYGPPTE